MPANNPDRVDGSEFLATIVFVVLNGLNTTEEGPTIPKALRALNEALLATPRDAYVLSTSSGAIIVIPDDFSWELEAVLVLLHKARTGFALRVGVTHGNVEVVTDVDGGTHLVGPMINVAARIAMSIKNPGALVHESYSEHVSSTLSSTDCLHSSRRTVMTIEGKAHDQAFQCFQIQNTFVKTELVCDDDFAWKNSVLISYDLPQFSCGDRAEQRTRFRRLVTAFRRAFGESLKATLFSPGGDGGVIVLRDPDLRRAAEIATRLRDISEQDGIDGNNAVDPRVRVGVHYGPVYEYRNARGISRPAGITVFAVDEIASDETARRSSDFVVTAHFADNLSDGSSVALANLFVELPALLSGPAAGVRRFASRRSVAAVEPATHGNALAAPVPDAREPGLQEYTYEALSEAKMPQPRHSHREAMTTDTGAASVTTGRAEPLPVENAVSSPGDLVLTHKETRVSSVAHLAGDTRDRKRSPTRGLRLFGVRTFLGTLGPIALAAGSIYVVLTAIQDCGMRNGEERYEAMQRQLVTAREPIYTAPQVLDSRCPAGMLFVSGGTFSMGEITLSNVENREPPCRLVAISPFCIDQTEVTVGAYNECVKRGQCTEARCRQFFRVLNNMPMFCVDWSQASSYCHIRGNRLPTEAEWEFAASSGGRHLYPWGEMAPTAAQVNGCAEECARGSSIAGKDDYEFLAPVGRFSGDRTPSGISDMGGNAAEWTSDYNSNLACGKFSNPANTTPAQEEYGAFRVVRGGSFHCENYSCVSAHSRTIQRPSVVDDSTGFRCVRGPLATE